MATSLCPWSVDSGSLSVDWCAYILEHRMHVDALCHEYELFHEFPYLQILPAVSEEVLLQALESLMCYHTSYNPTRRGFLLLQDSRIRGVGVQDAFPVEVTADVGYTSLDFSFDGLVQIPDRSKTVTRSFCRVVRTKSGWQQQVMEASAHVDSRISHS